VAPGRALVNDSVRGRHVTRVQRTVTDTGGHAPIGRAARITVALALAAELATLPR
jgi:hypothetical protein